MRLSDRLASRHSVQVMRESLREPVELRAVVREIRVRWPELDIVRDQENDHELVEEIRRRHLEDSWADVPWSKICRAGRVIFEHHYDKKHEYNDLVKYFYKILRESQKFVFARTLFQSYIQVFNRGSPKTIELAKQLSRSWEYSRLPIRALVDIKVFNPERVVSNVAIAMSTFDQPYDELKKLGFTSPHVGRLMDLIHVRFCSDISPRIERADISAVETLLRWVSPKDRGFNADWAAATIGVLVNPWINTQPPEEYKNLVIQQLIHIYGDPRIGGGVCWQEVKPDHRAVVMRWLVGASLETFFNVVTTVNQSHMWEPRRKFWLDLFNQGRMDEAWVILSAAGVIEATTMLDGNANLSFARIDGNAGDHNKCFLIMPIWGSCCP